jgi:nucleoid-associated protein YgaU
MADTPKPDAGAGDAYDVTQWYEVKKGDTLSKIAKEVYGIRRSTRKSSRPTRIV